MTDGSQKPQLAENKFTIRVVPVNNKPPRFVNLNPLVSVSQGGTYPLIPNLLEVKDTDTSLTKLSVTFIKIPRQGVLKKISERTTNIIKSG